MAENLLAIGKRSLATTSEMNFFLGYKLEQI
jgi:hypothetical protein